MVVAQENIVALGIVSGVTILLPILLLILFGATKILPWKNILAGIGCSFIFQGAATLLISQGFSMIPGFSTFTVQFALLATLLINVLFYGAVEEGLRLFGAKVLIKRDRSFRGAAALGLGFAFGTIMMTTGGNTIYRLLNSIALNRVDYDAMIAEMKPEEIASMQETLIDVQPLDIYLGLADCLFVVVISIFASVVIMRGVNLDKLHYYFYILAINIAYRSTTLLLPQFAETWIAETALVILSIFSFVMVLVLWKNFPDPAPDDSFNRPANALQPH